MDQRSLSRELSLISLGLIKDNLDQHNFDIDNINFENIFESGIELMINHCREELAECEDNLEKTYGIISEGELFEIKNELLEKSRNDIKQAVLNIEIVMNTFSDILDFPRLIAISDHIEVRNDIFMFFLFSASIHFISLWKLLSSHLSKALVLKFILELPGIFAIPATAKPSSIAFLFSFLLISLVFII